MKRVGLFLVLIATALSLACQPTTQSGNGNVNINSNSNAGVPGVEVKVPGDKSVPIIVTDDSTYPIQMGPFPTYLYLDPTDPSKHQRIKWCIFNNTEAKVIRRVTIEAKSSSGLRDPFEDPLPLTFANGVDPDDSACSKKYKPKRPAGTFDYRVTVDFEGGTTVSLDPQVVISDSKKPERDSNANKTGR